MYEKATGKLFSLDFVGLYVLYSTTITINLESELDETQPQSSVCSE